MSENMINDRVANHCKRRRRPKRKELLLSGVTKPHTYDRAIIIIMMIMIVMALAIPQY